MPKVTGAQFTSQTENKLGLKIHTHQIKKAIKNITKIKTTEKTNLPIYVTLRMFNTLLAFKIPSLIKHCKSDIFIWRWENEVFLLQY